MSDRFPLILNTSTNQIQEIASGDTLDLTGNNINGVGIITATTLSGTLSGIATLARGLIDIPSINVTNITGVGATFSGAVDLNSDLDVDGHTNLDNVSIAGVVTATTFSGSGASLTGIADANVASNAAIAGTKISPNFGAQNIVTTGQLQINGALPTIVLNDENNENDFELRNQNGSFIIRDIDNPQTRYTIASSGMIHTFHGAASFSSNLDVGAGIDVTGNSTFVNDIDVDGHTNLDNVSISGMTTSGNINISSSGPRITFTDSNENPDFYIEVNATQFLIQDATNNAQRFRIQSNGIVDIPGNTNFSAGIDVVGNATITGNLSVGGVLTYEDVTNIDSVGIITARTSIKLDADGSASSNFLSIGADDDLKIFHQSNVDKIESSANGFHIRQINNGDLHIHAGANTGSSNNRLVARAAGAAELYHSGNLKLTTTSTGANVTSANDAVLQVTTSGTASTDDARLELITQESSFIIQNDRSLGTDGALTIGDGTKTYFQASKDGSVELYENGNKVLETNSLGVTIGDNVGLSINGGTGNRTGTDAALYVDKTNNNDWCAKFKTNSGSSTDYGLRIEANSGASFPLVVNNGSDAFRVAGNGNVYANEFHGDGSNLTGISIGISTEQVTPSSNVATLNLAKDDHKIVASGTYTIDVSGGTEAGTHTLRIENSGTANVGFSTYFKFPSGGTPSLPTASGSISLVSFQVHKVGSVGVATVLLAGASVNFS